jgi:hypothetical protein
MENQDSEFAVQKEKPDTNPIGTSDRRGFLGGLGVMGFAAMAGVLNATPADAAQVQSASTAPVKLSSIGKVNVIRDETFEVPGGKEHILQYTVSDDKGITLRHSYNISRIDGNENYTTTSNFRVEEFAPGLSLQQQPSNTRTFQMTAYGVKGDVIGDRRHDTVTTTMVAEDGTVQRQTQVVRVRLDLSEFAGLDTAALVTKMGNIHLGKEQLSK